MAIDTDKLQETIRTFVTSTPHVQGAVLATHDGLPVASALSADIEESRAAAMAAAVMAISDRIGTELQRGQMQHITLSGSQGYSILTLCNSDALLLVLANPEVKQGILLLEIRRTVADIASILN
ncbi:MAG: roadblock/LC7 domain-containing protein [Phormidesmis sp.]